MTSHSDEFNNESGALTGAIVPSVIEKMGNRERVTDVFSRLHSERIVMINGPIEDTMASIVCAQLLELSSGDQSGKPITLMINSPGGSVTAGMAIFDVMCGLKCPVITIGMGQCCSMGSFLLAAGNERYALPNTTIMTHQPSAGTQGKVTDMEASVEHFRRIKDRMRDYYQYFLKLTDDEFTKIYERDTFFNAHAALGLGHIDKVIFKTDPKAALSQREKELLELVERSNMREIKQMPAIADIIKSRAARLAELEAGRAPANDRGSERTAIPAVN